MSLRFRCNLAMLLAEKRWRMSDLASASGVTLHTVSKYYYEKDIRLIDVEVAAKFCQALDCSLSDLFFFDQAE